MNVSLLKSMMRPSALQMIGAQSRQFSVAFNVKSKFEEAYASKMESMSKVEAKS